MLKEIICEYCKKPFYGEVRNSYKQRFCSKSCVKKYLWTTKEFQEKQRIVRQDENFGMRNKEASEETKKNMSNSMKKHWENISEDEREKHLKGLRLGSGNFKKGIIPWNKGLTKFTDKRVALNGKRTGDSLRGYKQSKLAIENMTKAITGKKRSPESIERYKFAAQKRCRENMTYWKNLQKSLNLRPNKPETKLGEILKEMFPNEYKYVGDFSFILGGKNPDFMNVNGQKKLLELYGTYWHRDDDPQERIDFFKQFGFDTLVIWENELKDIDKLKPKLEKFHNPKKEVIDVI